MSLRAFHLVIGLGTIVFFLGTGVYMRLNFPDLYEENEAIRYLFRANHVYILFSGLLNVLLGVYGKFEEREWRKWLQRVGSWFVLIAVPILMAAFVMEPPLATPFRPLTLIGAFASFFGVFFHLAGVFRRGAGGQ